MRVLNKFIKAIAMIPVHLIILLYSWFLSFITTAPIIIFVCCIMSIISTLPKILLDKFYLAYLIATVPFTIVYFILIETDRIKDAIKRSREEKAES